MNRSLRSLALLVALAPWAQAQTTPRVDGDFNEWSAVAPLATDPAFDASGPIDLRALRLASRGTELFVQFDVDTPLNLSSGPGSDPTLVLTVTSASAHVLTIDFRNRTGKIDGVLKTWPAIDFAAAPTTASTRFELRVDLALLGVAVGQSVSVQFGGSDSFSAPVNFTLSSAVDPVIRRSATRGSCTTLRLASLNTFLDGVSDSSRAPLIGRLLDAVGADVYVFQEEYNGSATAIRNLLNAADPKENGLPWTVLKSGELGIASQWTMIPYAIGTGHYAAVVRVPGGPDVLVITTHPKCCGYAGSSEDNTRISQAISAANGLAAFRAGAAGAALLPYKDAPVLLAGDWNLVGSTTPLDMWLVPGGPGLSRVPLPHLIGDDVWTWAAPSGTDFWPGVLDLMLYQGFAPDQHGLFLKNSFTLDSRVLTASERTALGLLTNDSAASDHLLAVADFGTLPSADIIEPDGVGLDDFFEFLNCFDQGRICADVDGNQNIDLDDFFAFLNAFDQSCE